MNNKALMCVLKFTFTLLLLYIERQPAQHILTGFN